MTKYSVILLLVFLNLSISMSALCQNKEEAKALFDNGIASLKNEEFAVALDYFKKAYEQSPHWAVLAHIGTCQAKLNKPLKAIKTLKKFIEQGGKNIPINDITTAKELIDEQKKQVGSVVLKVDKRGVEARLNGRPIGHSPFKELLVKPGTHIVTVVFSSSDLINRKINIEGGEELILRFVEEKHVRSDTATQTSSENPESSQNGTMPDPEQKLDTKKSKGLAPFIFFVSLASAGLITGSVSLGFFLHFNNSENNYASTLQSMNQQKLERDEPVYSWETTCADPGVGNEEELYYCTTEDERRMYEDKAKTFLIPTIVGGGTMLVAGIIAIVFYTKRDRFARNANETASFSVVPIIAPNNNGLMLNLKF